MTEMTCSVVAETFSDVMTIVLEESRRTSRDDKIKALEEICDITNDDDLEKSVDKLATEAQKKTMKRKIIDKGYFNEEDVKNLDYFIEWHSTRLPSRRTKKLEFTEDIWEDSLFQYKKEKKAANRMKFCFLAILIVLITGIIVGPIVLEAKLNSKTEALMEGICENTHALRVDCDVITCSCCYDKYDRSVQCPYEWSD